MKSIGTQLFSSSFGAQAVQFRAAVKAFASGPLLLLAWALAARRKNARLGARRVVRARNGCDCNLSGVAAMALAHATPTMPGRFGR